MSKKTKAGRSCACHREREATAAAQAVVVRLASCIRALVSSCACPENDRPCADFMRHDRCVTVASLLAETPADALATYVAERLAEAQATIARLREKLDARAVERAYRGEKAGT